MDDEEDRQSPNPEQTLFSQVLGWLQQEKENSRRRFSKDVGSATPSGRSEADRTTGNSSEVAWPSVSSDRSVSLDKLEKILQHYAAATKEDSAAGLLHRKSFRRHPSRPKGLQRGSASDSDYFEDAVVPSVNAVLDNTKTMSYSGGAASSDEVVREDELQSRRAKDKENWLVFKTEIVRLTHTLRLKGWRRVPMESCGDIEVTRLSGALTNAVYVVIPPRRVPPPKNADGTPNLAPRRPPP
jgi:choline kinase